MSDFIRGERGQGAIEYILLAGGIIVAAVVIFAMYSKMVGEAGNRWNESTVAASSIMSSRINSTIAEMF